MRTNKKYLLKIGYKDYVLRFVDKLEGNVGECDIPSKRETDKGQIRITKGNRPAEKANIILHEINHAIYADKGLTFSNKDEERIVLAMTNGMIAFIKDNPVFFRQLVKLVGEE